MPNPEFSLLQEITAGPNSDLSNNKQEVNLFLDSVRVFFDLEIISEDPLNPQDSLEETSIKVLKADTVYLVRVSCSFNSHPPGEELKQFPIYVKSGLELILEVQGTAAAVQSVIVANQGAKVEKSDLATYAHRFKLTTQKRCAVGDIQLVLKVREASSPTRPTVATTLTISLDGTYVPSDETELLQAAIDPTVRPPDNTAILYVIPAYEGYFRLQGWSGTTRLPQTNPIRSIQIDRYAEVSSPASAQALITRVASFSEEDVPQLIAWLRKLRELHGTNLTVVIAENLDAGLPWEMLELEPGAYLGSIASVVHWLPMMYYDAYVHLRIESNSRTGFLLGFVPDEVETDADGVLGIRALVNSCCVTPEEYGQRLAEIDVSTVGLLYFSSLGVVITGDEPVDLGAGSNGQIYATVGLDTVLNVNHGLPRGQRPIIFIDAQYSGLVFWHESKPKGVVKALLTRAADGYIGTWGWVDGASRRLIARQFLTKLQESEAGVRPAEVLREIRQVAASQLRQNPTFVSKIQFISAFRYVFYGNPFMVLKITHGSMEKQGVSNVQVE